MLKKPITLKLADLGIVPSIVSMLSGEIILILSPILRFNLSPIFLPIITPSFFLNKVSESLSIVLLKIFLSKK